MRVKDLKQDYDFSGYVTRYGVRCSDGRIIQKDAFAHCDGMEVPLVWNHDHTGPANVLGRILLENRSDGVYGYGKFNDDVEAGRDSKMLVIHGDVTNLSIWANKLKEKAHEVFHGAIREVSLVLAGANPEAFIDVVLAHNDESADEAIIYFQDEISLAHAEKEEKGKTPVKTEELKMEEPKMEEPKMEDNEKTMQEIYDGMTEEQKDVTCAMIGMAIQDNKPESEEGKETKSNPDESEGGKEMKHNVFDQDEQTTNNGVLSHAAQGEILALAKSSSVGSLRTAMEIYAEENELQHGDISGFEQTGNGNVSNLFPEYVEANGSRQPELITNDMGWVDAIMAKTQKIPHGRVRTSHVDIRNIDTLKAKGYTKGNQKKLTGDYALVRRTTDPQTVYVTSELHRDDVVDIEDFDYVQFQYNIDQISLKETLAVATMLGDDRLDSDPEKIFSDHIRPIWTDDELYTIHKDVDFATMATELQGTDGAKNFGDSFVYAEAMVTALRMARKDFRGTGKPDLYITVDMHNTMILARDRNGRRIYETDTELAAALGVANIYEVTQFEDKVRTDSKGAKHKLHAICVNMNDYGYGASKGGDVTHFTDFDIKFNQLESLLETRKSGQLTRIKSAIVLEEVVVTP